MNSVRGSNQNSKKRQYVFILQRNVANHDPDYHRYRGTELSSLGYEEGSNAGKRRRAMIFG